MFFLGLTIFRLKVNYRGTNKLVIKRMTCIFSYDNGKDCDLAGPFVMFAIMKVPSESLRFFPNDLVFGHCVRGPLDVMREERSGSSMSKVEPLLDILIRAHSRFCKVLEGWFIGSRECGQ